MFKTDTTFRAAALGLALVGLSLSALAQSVPVAAASAPASKDGKVSATIGEITDLSRQLRVELLKKELREARGEETKVETPETAKSEKGVASMGPLMMVPPLPPMKVIPPVPSVVAIYGQVGKPLRVRLSGGGELGVGEAYGDWKITEVTSAGASFERCEKIEKRGRKSETECLTRFVAPKG